MGRVAKECPICKEARKRGELVKQVLFVKLSQHLREKHGMQAGEAVRITNSMKGSKNHQRSSTNGRSYFICNLDGCGRKVLDRKQHLNSSCHRLGIRDVKEAFPYFERSRVRLPSQEERGPNPNPPNPNPNPGETEEHEVEEVEHVVAGLEEDKPYMTSSDISFTKYGRLVPDRFRLFPCVAQWHEFRIQRAGGNKKAATHKEDAGYVNRFLAHADFGLHGWSSVSQAHVTLHDNTIRDNYEAGSCGRILAAIGDFLAWCSHTRRIGQATYGPLKMFVDGCKSSNAKEIAIRTTQRRVEEGRNLVGADVYQRFRNSDFCITTMRKFKESPNTYLYDMAQVLIVLISQFNAPRPSVLANMRVVDVTNATTETTGYHTITVGKHKTSCYGMTAHLTIRDELYADMIDYYKAVRRIDPSINGTDTLFRNTKLEECTEKSICRMFSRAFELAGIQENMSFGINRKLTTSVARQADPTLAEPVARQLCHAVRTADSFYAVYSDRSRTADTVRRIEGAFRTAEREVTATVTSGELESMEEEERGEEEEREMDIDTTEVEEEIDEIKDPDYRPPSPKKFDLTAMTLLSNALKRNVPTSRRHYMSAEVKEELRARYRDIIMEYSLRNDTIPIKEIRGRREGRWPELTDLQIRDAIRNLAKKQRKQMGDEPTYLAERDTEKNRTTHYERDRRSEHDKQKEKTEALQYKILNHVEDGLEVRRFENTGRGVVATKHFKRGDFVVEYAGELLDTKEARKREQDYSKDQSKGNFMFFFTFKEKNYCIDATEESDRLGRLLNHSKTAGNCVPKTVDVLDYPCVVIFASRDIAPGEELRYDYGDRQKKAIELNPWLKH